MMALQLVLTDCADLLSEKTVHLTYNICNYCHSRIFDGQNNRTIIQVLVVPWLSWCMEFVHQKV